MQLIDTHVHINFDVFQNERDALRSRWQEAGVQRLVHSCVEPQEFEGIRALADGLPELAFAVGLHPLEAHQWGTHTAERIEALARSDPRAVAIGETGLDLYKAQNEQQQRLACYQQLAIAQRLDKPAIIHCRAAAESMRDLLAEFWQAHGPVRGVMHCWGGTPEQTQWFLDFGFYISFSGIVTFKNARQVQAAVQMVPADRIAVETDCPFLAPEPYRGKRNEPSYVRHVAEQVAQLRGTSPEGLAQQASANACRLFALEPEAVPAH
jgi:TatD DNase family protein